MRIIRKLKNKQGASAILGLLFFFICFFVAAVVMSAASVNISRARAQKEEQQAYLAINAADALIRKEFTKIINFNAEEVVVTHDCHICANEYDAPVIGQDVDTNVNYDDETGLNLETQIVGVSEQVVSCAVKNMVADLAENVYYTKTRSVWTTTPFDVTAWSHDFTVEAEGMKDVHVHVTADSNYCFYFEMSVDTKIAVAHTSTLKVKASVTNSTNSVTVENQCPEVIDAYGTTQKGHPVAGQFTIDADGNSHPVFRDYSSNIISYKTVIVWNNFTTTKGELFTGEGTTTTHA